MNKENIRNTTQAFCDSIDMDYQVEFIKQYAAIGDSPKFGGKHCGSDAEHQGSEFIAEKMKEIGLQNVELLPVPTTRYQFRSAELKININGEERVIDCFGIASPGTDESGIRGEVVNAGFATKDALAANDINGKIVLMEDMSGLAGENLHEQLEEAILHGAKAVIVFGRHDMLNDETIRTQYPRVAPKVPVVTICAKDACAIAKQLEKGKVPEASLVVDAEFIPDGGVSYNVIGEIPGEASEEQIVFSGHLDHFFRCIQDNISSCATVLGIAKAMIDSGCRPKRTMLFALHASHECGPVNTRYSYLHGAYYLTHVLRPDWGGKTLMNINFEYSALKLHVLDVLISSGSDVTICGYREFAPELTGGFLTITDYVDNEKSAMLAYCDSGSYTTAGIPSVTNDVMSEQVMEEPTSPYCGRDHSNMDNWDIFDAKALEDTARYYGGLGIYIDLLPYAEFDFSKVTERFRKHADMGAAAEAGIDADAVSNCLNEYEEAAKAYYEMLHSWNTADPQGAGDEIYKSAESLNRESLRIFNCLQEGLDKITPGYAVFCQGSLKYLENVMLLKQAIAYLSAGEGEKALEECLAYVDICGKSMYFSREIVDELQRELAAEEYADKRAWAGGKETTCLSLYDCIDGIKSKIAAEDHNYKEEISMLGEAMASETDGAVKRLEAECGCMAEVTKRFRELTAAAENETKK